MSAQQNQLKDLTDGQFRDFSNSYSYKPVSLGSREEFPLCHFVLRVCTHTLNPISQSALQFLEAYSHEDVTVAELQGSSNSLWTISPPSRQYLGQVLSLDHFPLTVSWTIQRFRRRRHHHQ